jgi:hypothetical protein
VALIYLPIIRWAYCHMLPYIEASQHQGSQYGFYLFYFVTRLRLITMWHYLPIIRSAYRHMLPYIEASQHHGSLVGF